MKPDIINKCCYGSQIIADSVKNYKESIRHLLATDKAYLFIGTVKRIPVYWKQSLHEVLKMVKQLGIPNYFMTLSCAGLRRDGMPYRISKLSKLSLTDEHLKNLPYQQCCRLLNDNSVLLPLFGY